MKCVKLKNAKDLQIATIKKPVSKDGSVIIRVKACGICGSDLHYFEAGEPKELILGHEFSGIVVDPGDRVDLKIGDRITGLPISPCGVCIPCKTGNIHYCANTWTNAVGLSLTKAELCSIVTKCKNEFLNATNPDVIEKSIKKTNGGFDKVIECCGNKYAVSEAIMTVKPGGIIVLVGVSLTEISIPVVASVMKEVNMQGAIAYTEQEFETVIKLIEKNIIDVSKYIDSKIPLEKVQDAYLELTSGITDKIKIVVKP